MITKKDLVKITPFIWEIPKTKRTDMRVPARIFAFEKMLAELSDDRTLEQLVNITTLPGIVQAAYAMPDAHEGYGFPIGGVAATIYPDGVISPGGIGYDINCGIRLLMSTLTFEDISHHQGILAKKLFEAIPSGVGRGSQIRLDDRQLDEVLKNGVNWAIAQGYGNKDDAKFLESGGILANADPASVSDNAKNRGRDQIGTLGAGNHFVEIDRVDEVFDPQISNIFGLFIDQLVVLIHTGSRGLGHQVATDYIKIMQDKLSTYKITLPDKELACAPLSAREGSQYFQAMAAAANFAWVNRQFITRQTRQVFQELFPKDSNLSILYDVAHNIAKIEEHQIDGKFQKVVVHRKGATRSFGPNSPDVVDKYQQTGQPVIIPGSMGTASYVLVGTTKAMDLSLGSTCHGAGRRMSRHQAKKEVSGKKLKVELEREGIFIQARSIKGLAEEAPIAYKNVHDVVDVVNLAGIAKKVAKLKPVVVVKG